MNHACEELLGVVAAEVIGRPCHEVLAGHDLFGNPYCSPTCAVSYLRDQGREVRPFELCLSRRRPVAQRVRCSVLNLDGRTGDHPLSIHVLRPVEAALEPVPCSGGPGPFTTVAIPPAPSPAPPDMGVAADEEAADHPLTDREHEVLGLVAKGVSTREIGAVLYISPTTVRNHVANILKKLDVSSRLAAVAYSREMGFID